MHHDDDAGINDKAGGASDSPGDFKIGGGTNPGGKHPLPGMGHPGLGKTHTNPETSNPGDRSPVTDDDEDTDAKEGGSERDPR
jgi:hypothetical protein